jgi:hypothetical protein
MFARWMDAPERQANDTTLVQHELPTYQDSRRIQGLVRYLDREVKDRSRRDFAVLASLVELGLSRAEIWRLVQGRSKFATHGEAYFHVTFENVLNKLGDTRTI